MHENRMLYQIKTLEKLILRYFTNELSMDIDKMSLIAPTQMQIIEYMLKHSNEEIYQKDLENVLNLRRATVSGVLHTMEKNNLIERVVHLKDARAKRIILNEDAKMLFLKNEKRLEELENIITENISVYELDVFSKVLNTMKENIEKKL